MTSVETVFVYADGQVGVKSLDARHASLPVFRVPVIMPFCFQQNYDDAPPTPCFDTVDYTRKRRMFDGRPVFCAKGFDVKEAAISTLVRDYAPEIEKADNHNRREVRRFVKKEHGDAIELDERFGSAPLGEEYRGQALAHREARLLFAVKSA